jgi:alpha galactosidase C-like protein/alpha galactosidase A-like protein
MRGLRSLRRMGIAAVAATLLGTILSATTAGASGSSRPTDAGYDRSTHPYLGWSSWSLQASKYPGLNPQGNYSWLTEDHVLQQAQAMAGKLKSHGYEYVNIDAGWWMDWDWNQEYDQYGRQTPDPERFPDGIAYVAKKVHKLGLKLGIYMPVGLEKGAYDKGDFPIYGAPQCSTHDIVYDDLHTTNGWDSSYAIDFDKPCAQKYIDSLAEMFDGWGVDFLKLDGVGPGSGRTGADYDNVPDVAAWDKALAATHRHIEFQLSWALDHDYVADWQKYADSWRIDNDIECYCSTLTNWRAATTRFTDVLPWIGDAGPKTGWNNLDSLDVGNGQMDGLTDDERQTTTTLWAIEAAPLYSGDDLTKLDDYGLSLLTNDEVIGIDQAGVAARPVSTDSDQQVWYAKEKNGTYVVALFNLAGSAATVTAGWSDVGFTGTGAVRDVWSHTDLGSYTDGYSATVPAHGSELLVVTPSHHG